MIALNEMMNGTVSKKKLIEAALRDLFLYSVDGLIIRESDQAYFYKRVANSLINDRTALKLKKMLLIEKSIPEYEQYRENQRNNIEEGLYRPYFESFNTPNGSTVHNGLLDMDWNESNQCWLGQCSGYALMPYLQCKS